MPDFSIPGAAGVRAVENAVHRRVFKASGARYLPIGYTIDGTKSGDPGNTPDVGVLRAGTLMGKITASGKYANSIISAILNAEIATATALEVSLAAAAELVRRVGAAGTFKLVGPPTAAGTVGVETVTYSAVNTSTGVITVTALVAAFVAGSMIQPSDGSETILTFIPDGFGIPLGDADGTRRNDIEFPKVPIAGIIESAQLLPWPADASIKARIVAQLNAAAGGQFIFDHVY